LDLSFVGVAIPFGTIAGLVIYLIYYALSSKPQADDEELNPFGIDRLLMIGLIAAMLAHYVEIHFGIAIAATRTYFFVYAALMFMVGYYLPRIGMMEPEPEYVKRKGRRRRARTHSISRGTSGWISPTLSYALILGLIIGILAYDYITFSLPNGQVIETIEQVPSAGEIFHQSFFVNPKLGFSDSPFLFILLVMTWVLGGLVMVSEMAKNDQIGLKGISKKLISGRNRTGIILLIGMALLSVGIAIGNNFVVSSPSLELMGRMGFWLLLIWAGICLWAAVKLYQDETGGRFSAGLVALVGLAFALPVLVAGGTLYAFALVIFCGAILYLLWDESWSDLLLPAGIVGILSMAIGLTYAYLHAYQIRAGILLPPGVTETTPTAVRRVLETDQAASVLTTFYFFALLMLVTTGLALALSKMNLTQHWATLAGAVVGILLIPIVGYLISTTNLRVIQADIVYKRADPWDKQAGRAGDPDLWDNAIAIYEHAIELAPLEDFYYLWLGRAYLERSSVTQDPTEREALLRTAADRLEQAQNLNPFNTDHTANLARLNTRWAEITEGEVRQVRVSDAVDYYESALSLSPKNSVIRNEYARLAYLLEQDCEKALTLYDKSVDVDPYFTTTFFDRAEVYMACAEQQSETERASYYRQAAESMETGLERSAGDARRWMQLAEMYVRLDETSKAIDAYQEALAIGDENLPDWQLDYTLAQWFYEEGDLDNAESFGENALASAPDDAVTVIQQFLTALNSGGVETEG
jgi:tetratricopeptide (TPR) repeat protein